MYKMEMSNNKMMYIVSTIKTNMGNDYKKLSTESIKFFEDTDKKIKSNPEGNIEFTDIAFLKKIAIDLNKIMYKSGAEFENIVNDFIFTIERDYKDYFGLNEHHWEMA